MKQQLIPHVREIVTGIAAAALAASLLPSTALAQHAHDGMAKAAPGPEAMQAMPRLQEKRVITVKIRYSLIVLLFGLIIPPVTADTAIAPLSKPSVLLVRAIPTESGTPYGR